MVIGCHKGTGTAFPESGVHNVHRLVLRRIDTDGCCRCAVFADGDPRTPGAGFQNAAGAENHNDQNGEDNIVIPARGLQGEAENFRTGNCLDAHRSACYRGPVQADNTHDFRKAQGDKAQINAGQLADGKGNQHSEQGGHHPGTQHGKKERNIGARHQDGCRIRAHAQKAGMTDSKLTAVAVDDVDRACQQHIQKNLYADTQHIAVIHHNGQKNCRQQQKRYQFAAVFVEKAADGLTFFFHFAFLPILMRSPFGKKIRTIIRNTNAIMSRKLDENSAMP